MVEIGLSVPVSGIAHTLDEANARSSSEIGLPIIIRPAYILGGRGTGIASTAAEFEDRATEGLDASPISEILIEKSIAGWKEYELEVIRDCADNCVVICSIENVDAMGVHTGDSITVAPAQTLSDVEYQQMRDAAFACIRRVGVETGGSNVQFAVNPATGEQVVIEMNPRVSRSSALASKATGFPIAKIAAKLAVGYTLDEIDNDITQPRGRLRPASSRPSTTSSPRSLAGRSRSFRGRRASSARRCSPSAKRWRSAEPSPRACRRACDRWSKVGWASVAILPRPSSLDRATGTCSTKIAIPTPDRIFQIGELLRRGVDIETIHDACDIDAWFLDQMLQIVEERAALAKFGQSELTRAAVATGKANGLQRRTARVPVEQRRADRARRPRIRRGRPDVQDRRHVRSGVCCRDAISLLDIRGRERGTRLGSPARRDLRQRAEPHRPRHRVRLLLRARRHSRYARRGTRR